MATALLGDIGATNARLQIVRISADGNQYEEVYQEVLPVQQFPTFPSCLLSFLHNRPPCDLCVLGITGIIDENKHWNGNEVWPAVRNEELLAIGFRKVVLLNDLEAAGYGVIDLREDQIHEINPGTTEVPNAPKIILSLGTGMGFGLLTSHNGSYHAWHSEACFADFAAKSAVQYAYRTFMQEQYLSQPLFQGEVPNEVTVAGYSGALMYQFFTTLRPDLEDKAFTEQLNRSPMDAFRMWVQAGFAGTDKLSENCVDFLCELLGGIGGNFATGLLPKGGVYFAGGVILRNLHGFLGKKDIVKQAFLARPKHVRTLLQTIPMRFVDSGVEIGMVGTLYYAKTLVRKREV